MNRARCPSFNLYDRTDMAVYERLTVRTTNPHNPLPHVPTVHPLPGLAGNFSGHFSDPPTITSGAGVGSATNGWLVTASGPLGPDPRPRTVWPGPGLGSGTGSKPRSCLRLGIGSLPSDLKVCLEKRSSDKVNKNTEPRILCFEGAGKSEDDPKGKKKKKKEIVSEEQELEDEMKMTVEHVINYVMEDENITENNETMKVTREMIAEKVKSLPDLIPACYRLHGDDEILEDLINYIKILQGHVQFFSTNPPTPPVEIPCQALSVDDYFVAENNTCMMIPTPGIVQFGCDQFNPMQQAVPCPNTGTLYSSTSDMVGTTTGHVLRITDRLTATPSPLVATTQAPWALEANMQNLQAPWTLESKMQNVQAPWDLESNMQNLQVPWNLESNMQNVQAPWNLDPNMQNLQAPWTLGSNMQNVQAPWALDPNMQNVQAPWTLGSNMQNVQAPESNLQNIYNHLGLDYDETPSTTFTSQPFTGSTSTSSNYFHMG